MRTFSPEIFGTLDSNFDLELFLPNLEKQQSVDVGAASINLGPGFTGPLAIPTGFNFYYDDLDLYLSDIKGAVTQGSVDTPLQELIPADPLFNLQWHLHNTTAGQYDINVTEVWDDYTGDGVQVVVADTGTDYTHADLAANYRADIDYDYTSGDFDPAATPGENHGTSVLGIIGAVQGNGIGAVGVAFGADLVSYRGFGIGSSQGDDLFLDAAGLGDGIGNTNGNSNGSDIISMSGGFGSNVFVTNANADDAIDALGTVTANGRDGLGLIYVKSSGNSRAAANSTAREEGTAERYDSTEFSINVAALRQDGWVTDFSTPGANVLVSAFADDINNFSSIVATDRTGADGYSSADHTTTFGGTSAAAPQVAGVIALMLEANEELGWRDVQTILALSARHGGSDVGSAANSGAPSGGGHEQATQLDGSSWFWNDASNWNGGGLHFSNDYGYGIVDALAAVRLAESWELQSTTANQLSTFEDDFDTTVTFDNDTQTFIISESENISMEHVSIELDFQTTFLSDLEVYLVSPSGTRVQLIADTGDSGDYNGVWRFGTTAFAGEESSGDWQLIIVDDAGGDPLTIRDVVLRTSGSAVSDDDLFILTNEFSDYAGVAGHVTSFIGNALGTNTLNAAAVSLASTIDLSLGTGTVDGVSITTSNIHRVFTGDGNDTVIGDGISNFYSTGRGDDTITGGINDDTIIGGAGDDILDGGDGTDYAIFDGVQADFTIVDNGDGTWTITGEGTDTLSNIEFASFTDGDVALDSGGDVNLTEGNDNYTGTAADQVINGLGGNDIIDGAGGDDVINGGDGADRLIGGLGADELNGGAGFDSADYRGATSGVRFNVESGGTFGEALGDTFFGIERYYLSDFNDIVTGSDANEFFFGEDGNDTINGGDGIDRIDGGAGNDILRGGEGNDLIFGSAGGDQINGGTGFDIASYENSTSRVVLNLGSGGTLGDAAGDTYFGIEVVRGSDFDDIIAGNASSNELRGRDGDDILNGGAGNDRLFGGLGADALNGGTGVDIAVYTDAAAGVTLDLDTGGVFGEAAGDTFSSIEWVFGSDFDDSITGNNGANRLEGRDGNDDLDGGAGNDRLLGGNGNDFIQGGDGVDTIFGQDGDDILNGGAGNDFFFGGAGADNHDGGTGIDTVSYLASSTGLTVDMNNSNNSTGDAAGDDFFNIERIFGSGFDDILIGGADAVTLIGNGGNDYLEGGSENDTLIGGAGVDSYGYDVNGPSSDVIIGFATNEVIYILGNNSDFDTWAEVQAVGTDVGANVIFDFGFGATLTLVGQSLANLDANNFDFSGVPPEGEFGEGVTEFAVESLSFDEIVALHEGFDPNPEPLIVAEAPALTGEDIFVRTIEDAMAHTADYALF